MSAAAAIPVFVLGLQRSGTTLAANLLAAQPGIAAVADPRHQGVHESVYFSHFTPAMAPWPGQGSRAEAAADFLASEYYRLSGLPRQWGEQAAEASCSPAELFCRVMQALALRKGAVAWVEKSPHHTLLAEEIAAAVPEARFLCISRRTPDLLRSRLWSYGRRPPPYPRRALLIARACASNIFHQRYMRSLPERLGRERVFQVSFEALCAGPGVALAPLLAALGLGAGDLKAPEYAANSSFSSSSQRLRALTATDLAFARAAAGAAWLMPQALLRLLQQRMARRRPRVFPPWVWPQAGEPAGHRSGQLGTLKQGARE